MDDTDVIIRTVVSEVFEENCFIAFHESRNDCIVVDPGLDPDKVLAAIAECQRTPAAILCTHGHADHIAGNAALKEQWPECPLIIGKGDAWKLTDPAGNLSRGFGFDIVSPPADRTVVEGEVLSIAGFDLEVADTPGHSPGHVVFIDHGLSPTRVFGGDVLFQGSVGRTDFPDGSWEDLRKSIHDKLFPLPDDTVVLPGHGPVTTIGQEKKSNPFVGLG